MRMHRMILLSLAVLAFFCATLLSAAVTQAAPPTITYVTADLTKKTISIHGYGFGAAPKAYMGTTAGRLYALTILSKSSSSIMARLPVTTAGSYLLSVANGVEKGVSNLTISAAGPPGPQGPQGLQGPAGPKGEPGLIGYACWDVNGSGTCDNATEDLNQDGVCSVTDCRMPIILSGQDYSCKSLANSNFSRVILTGANFNGANLKVTDFSYANLTGASFTSSGCYNTTDLSAANLSYAILYAANLNQANLTGADLTGADLTSANLTYAILTGATLTGATITNATWSSTICPDDTKSNTNGTNPQSCVGHGGGL